MHSLVVDNRLVVFTLLDVQHHKSGIAWFDILNDQSLSFTFSIKLLSWKKINKCEEQKKKKKKKKNKLNRSALGGEETLHSCIS